MRLTSRRPTGLRVTTPLLSLWEDTRPCPNCRGRMTGPTLRTSGDEEVLFQVGSVLNWRHASKLLITRLDVRCRKPQEFWSFRNFHRLLAVHFTLRSRWNGTTVSTAIRRRTPRQFAAARTVMVRPPYRGLMSCGALFRCSAPARRHRHALSCLRSNCVL